MNDVLKKGYAKIVPQEVNQNMEIRAGTRTWKNVVSATPWNLSPS